jgi:hypothetical protein
MNDNDIYGYAQILIELHGKDALKESRSVIHTSIASNDNNAVSLWCKIEGAILDLHGIAVGSHTIN